MQKNSDGTTCSAIFAQLFPATVVAVVPDWHATIAVAVYAIVLANFVPWIGIKLFVKSPTHERTTSAHFPDNTIGPFTHFLQWVR